MHKALDDAVAATDANHFSDERTGGIVVCGPQGRAHVFNAGGRHITSFSIAPEAVAYRLRTSRWKPMSPENLAEFRARIRTLAEGATPGKKG